MKHFLFTLALSLALYACKKTEQPQSVHANYPFPQHVNYAQDIMKPDNYTQEQLDDHVRQFYDKWKAKYIKSDCGNGQYYVFFDSGNTINVSEGLGYGMMITAYMAGYDEKAKEYFDGMYKFYKAHPSTINSYLMAWQQITGCIDNPDGGNDAASDGDIDIAFALLLAHKQWGSDGDINYIFAAKNIINAIMEDEINPLTHAVKLGDWADINSTQYYHSTRTSDFITDHFRAFMAATNNTDWQKTVDKCYELIDYIQNNFSNQTGLLPDFVINVNENPQPAQPDFLESPNDGYYYYNACRVPWRLTNDYVLTGDQRLKKYIDKLNNWIIATTAANPENIKSGYKLDGTVIGDYQDICFYGAFAVSAMLSDNQKWINDLYEMVINEDINNNGYFGNTLKMLYLITISGNYWSFSG